MINLLDPKFKIAIKIIGIACLIIAALIYGDYCYMKGKIDQCAVTGGLLMYNKTLNVDDCLSPGQLGDRGINWDPIAKTLQKRSQTPFNASLRGFITNLSNN